MVFALKANGSEQPSLSETNFLHESVNYARISIHPSRKIRRGKCVSTDGTILSLPHLLPSVEPHLVPPMEPNFGGKDRCEERGKDGRKD